MTLRRIVFIFLIENFRILTRDSLLKDTLILEKRFLYGIGLQSVSGKCERHSFSINVVLDISSCTFTYLVIVNSSELSAPGQWETRVRVL